MERKFSQTKNSLDYIMQGRKPGTIVCSGRSNTYKFIPMCYDKINDQWLGVLILKDKYSSKWKKGHIQMWYATSFHGKLELPEHVIIRIGLQIEFLEKQSPDEFFKTLFHYE